MNAYRRCPAAWAYRYVDGIKIAPAWAIKGRAQHKGLEVNYRQKVESREDLPLDDVLDAFRTEAQAAAESTTEEVVLFPGESLGKIVDDGVAGLKTYQQAIAPTVQPLMVEERVTIPLPWGSTLLGIMDVVDEGLRIRDAKFPADAMRADDLMYEAQPPLYSLAYKIKTGEWPAGVVFDVVSLGRAKAPNPKAESIPITVTPARVEAELRDLRAVEEAIQAGTVYRRPSAFNCNRCGYRRLCWGNGTPKGASEAA
jgi:hypothetical protein